MEDYITPHSKNRPQKEPWTLVPGVGCGQWNLVSLPVEVLRIERPYDCYRPKLQTSMLILFQLANTKIAKLQQ